MNLQNITIPAAPMRNIQMRGRKKHQRKAARAVNNNSSAGGSEKHVQSGKVHYLLVLGKHADDIFRRRGVLKEMTHIALLLIEK